MLIAFVAIASGLLLVRAIGPLWMRPELAWAGLGLSGAGWLLALRWVARGERCAGSADSLRPVLLGALLLRVIVFGGDFALSDDVYRYVWEGELVAAGQSPYAYAPQHEIWEVHRERLPGTLASLNHPEVPAAYPPATQLLCAAGVTLGELVFPARAPDEAALLGVRSVFAICDLLVTLALAALCRRLGRARRWSLVWGWSPLVVLELSGSTHFDAAGILALVLALTLFAAPSAGSRPKAALAGAVLAAGVLAVGVLIKYLPIAAAPFVLRSTRHRAVVSGAFVLVTALLAAPFVLFEPAGFGAAQGLSSYAFRWESTSLVFRFLEEPLARLGHYDESLTDPRRLARLAIAVAWLAAALWLFVRRVPPWRATAVLIGLFIVLSPTLHPWYLTWIVPFVALRPTPAWLWLCCAAPLLYAPAFQFRAGGAWAEPAWLWPTVALPFFALAASTALRPQRP